MDWEERLRAALRRGEGVRFGETAVVSRRVHTVELREPGVVSVLRHLDAGQVFYGRRRPDEILHVDLFHAVARVDPRGVAAAICRALQACGAPDRAHDIDIQTGAGGGRLTGSLTWGQRPTLLASHRNHVHLAALLPDEALGLVLPILRAVEAEILAQGVELRRVEGLRHPPPTGGGPALDLSHYADFTDSRLREPPEPRTATAGVTASPAAAGSGAAVPAQASTGTAGTGAAVSGTPAPAGATQGTPTAVSPGLASDAAAGGPIPAPDGAEAPPGPAAGAGSWAPWEALAHETRLQEVLRLASRLGSPAEIHRALDAVRSGQAAAGSVSPLGSQQANPLLRDLEEEGLVRRDGRALRLTEAGKALAAFLDGHLREVTMRFRRRIRRVPREALPVRPRPGERPSLRARYGPTRPPVPAPPGSWLGDLAVPETVIAGVRRAHLVRVGAGGGPAPALCLERGDLHVYRRPAEEPLYICLLIDASASMAGRRIRAAKHLVRHLLAITRDRIAVVAFQEREVRVQVPFTRDWARVEAALARLQPMGLTPLAHGLVASLELIQRSRVRRPLLLLVTDGIPTVPRWSIDPLADGLEAARQVARSRVPFGCVGLMPSRRYLEELARTAGGTLHVVEELEEGALLRIAHHERRRLMRTS
ncbi:VWA domain-containing protein [Caldinitratiruptor microaerophilus]|uniref:VWFA domain-containing protein n=1 Tax=Caldinitratiruptor microaerophilus TaxID=671077 RepID=A0AA35CL17_9FIRM|nr:VWA domain-containing protein [Caldinitratiruptor microaerophilus]BDG59276.1 hypothetical protein caldi_03660 [Caldinitratiruptor microaerophilus]